jgi:hypothetical protein
MIFGVAASERLVVLCRVWPGRVCEGPPEIVSHCLFFTRCVVCIYCFATTCRAEFLPITRRDLSQASPFSLLSVTLQWGQLYGKELGWQDGLGGCTAEQPG